MALIEKNIEPKAFFKQVFIGVIILIVATWALVSFSDMANYIYLSVVCFGGYRLVMRSEMFICMFCAASVMILKFVEWHFI